MLSSDWPSNIVVTKIQDIIIRYITTWTSKVQNSNTKSFFISRFSIDQDSMVCCRFEDHKMHLVILPNMKALKDIFYEKVYFKYYK